MKNAVIRNLLLIALAVALFFLGGEQLGRWQTARGETASLLICWALSFAVLVLVANEGITWLERLIKRRGRKQS